MSEVVAFTVTLAIGVLLGYVLGHEPCRRACCKPLNGRFV